jgi:uncharacterized repeat protein (TIGR01451 family)
MVSKNTLSKGLALALLAFLVISTMQVRADSGQYGQYGPGQPSHKILIDKFVGRPTTTKGGTVDPNYVDNYSASDTRFRPEELVFFKLVVKNTSSEKLTDIKVKDTLPSYVDALEGPGSFDSASRSISFNVGDLNAGEQKVYYLKTRVVKQNQLPADKGVMCLVNKAEVYNSKVRDEDTAQFCVEKTVTPGTTVPKAGPEMGLALMAGNFAALAAGIFLKRKTS